MSNKLYVQSVKMRGYYEQVSDAAADIGATSGYAQIHGGDTGGFDGLLADIEAPVRSFAQAQGDLLQDWKQRLHSTGVGLWIAARRYDDTDAQASQRMDDLAGEPRSESFGGPQYDPFADVVAPRYHLKQPEAPDNSAQFALKDIGSALPSVNWIIEKATGRNLVQDILQPISGDWGKIRMQAETWANVDLALGSVRENLQHGLGNLEPFWEGTAADGFYQHMEKWQRGLSEEADLARAAAEKLELVAQTSEAIFTQLTDILGKIVDKAWQVPLGSAIPIARWPILAKLGKDTIDLIKKADELINELRFTLTSLREVLEALVAHANVSAPPETVVPGEGWDPPPRVGR